MEGGMCLGCWGNGAMLVEDIRPWLRNEFFTLSLRLCVPKSMPAIGFRPDPNEGAYRLLSWFQGSFMTKSG